MTVLAADGLVVGHAGRPLLPPVSFAVLPGERWVLVGRNGAGKSTLLKTLLGLLPPVAGRFTRPEPARVGYLSQRHGRDPLAPMRAYDLVAEGLDAGWSFWRPLRGRRLRVEGALGAMGALPLARRAFHRLSEGQKQRVLLARAIVAEPALLVLDEPTSAMDLVGQREALALLDGLPARPAVLLVSHHLAEALAFATHAIFVDAEAGVAWAGPASALRGQPAFARHFGGVLGEG